MGREGGGKGRRDKEWKAKGREGGEGEGNDWQEDGEGRGSVLTLCEGRKRRKFHRTFSFCAGCIHLL
jgi:hypothetical protein